MMLLIGGKKMSSNNERNTLYYNLSSNQEYFLMNLTVVIIKHYRMFGLSKIKYTNTGEEFIVDTNLLRTTPDNTKTLSLKVLGGY